MLKACFTIKTIHNYSGLIIVFYHSFSSCREWGQRWDQDPVYCWAAQGAAGPCGGREITQDEGPGDRSEMGESISSKNGDSASWGLQSWAPAACCFQHIFFSHLFWITEMMNWKNAVSFEELFLVFTGNRLSVLSGQWKLSMMNSSGENVGWVWQRNLCFILQWHLNVWFW